MGLADVVKVIEHDFTSDSVFNALPKEGTVDLVTMSYSFSMIPNQKAALVNATKLIKKKTGLIAIADFFLNGNHDDSLPPMSHKLRQIESMIHKRWFAMDNVHLLNDSDIIPASLSKVSFYPHRQS